MFDAYKIAVRVSLVNQVSAGLAQMIRQFAQTSAQANALQRRLNSIKMTATAGAGLLGGAAVMAAPFLYAIDKAAELQKQMLGIQVTTRGTVAEMNNMRATIENVASRTVFSNIDVAKMGKLVAAGTGLDAKTVTQLLPEYARFADVQYIMKGTSYDESVKNAIRLAHTAQHYDPDSLRTYLDTLTKASFIVPGGLGEVGHALKYSQGVAKTALGVDDPNMVLLVSLLNRLGFSGSRGGTNLIAAMTRTIPGIFGSGLLTGKSNEALKAMGMTDAQGHSKFLANGKFDAFQWMQGMAEYVQTEFAKNPEGIARQHIMTNFQHAFGAQGSRVASLLSDPQALEQFRLIGENFKQFAGTGAIQEKFANESVAQQWMNAKTNFVSAMTELGITLLPMASEVLKKVNFELQGLIKWLGENQGKAKALAYGFITLSAAMAFGGTVLLLSAAFRGLGLALAMNAVGGAPGILRIAGAIGAIGKAGLVGAIGALASPVGIAVAALATLALAIYAFRPISQSEINDVKDQGGANLTAGARAAMHDPETIMRLAALGDPFHKGGSQFVQPKGQQPLNITVNNTVDERGLTTIVTRGLADAMNRPQSTSSGFDFTRSAPPIGHSFAR